MGGLPHQVAPPLLRSLHRRAGDATVRQVAITSVMMSNALLQIQRPIPVHGVKAKGKNSMRWVCVFCDGSRNYYKGKGDDEKDKCIYCFVKKVNVEGNACVCEESSCINSKKEWDSTNCKCGACKHVNECMGKGTFNMETCECVVESEPEPEPETAEINVYRGCFTQSNSALYMPLDEGLLGKTQKWRVGCFDSEQDYVTAANSLHNASGNAEEIVQKLYDCATKYDKISIKRNKDSFIDELFNEARECNRGNLNPNDVINAEIKL